MGKVAAGLALVVLLAACDQIYVATSPAVFHEISDPCTSRVAELRELAEAVRSGVRSPEYAKRAEEIATTCSTARDDLSIWKAPPPCIEIAERVRTSAENLKLAFEGREDRTPLVLVPTQDMQPITSRCMKKLTPSEPAGA